MPIYLITVPIKVAIGNQYYTVDAESPEDAIARWNAGEADFEKDDIRVAIDRENVTAELGDWD